MRDPIFDAVPGTRRCRSEVEDLRWRVGQLVAKDPADAAARGALDAARWTLGEVAESPLSQGRPVGIVGFEAEREFARSIALGLLAGDRERAVGVRDWLEWWLCVSALPAWLAPPTQRRGL